MTLQLWHGGSHALAADVVPLSKGKPAPFTGMLYPVENAINISKKAESCKFALSQEKILNEKLSNINKESCENRISILKDGWELKQKILTDALKKEPVSIGNVLFGYTLGVVTVGLAAWTLNKAKD